MKFKTLTALLMVGVLSACQTTLHPENRISISNVIEQTTSDTQIQEGEIRLSNVEVGKYDRKGGLYALSLKSSSYIQGDYQHTPFWVIEPDYLDAFKEILANFLEPTDDDEPFSRVDLGKAGSVIVFHGVDELSLKNFMNGSFTFTRETVAELYQFLNKPYVLPGAEKPNRVGI